MKAETLIKTIVEGNYSTADLASIYDAVRGAQDIVKQRSAAIMKATLKKGDKVVLSGLRPKAINGMTAVVVEVRNTRVSVDMPTDWKLGKWSGAKSVGVPLNCVAKA